MDQSKRIIMETGVKEVLKHLTNVQEELDKQFKHLAIAQQELDKLVHLSQDIMEDSKEKVHAISANVLNGSLQNVGKEKNINVAEKNDTKFADFREKKVVTDEGKSAKRRRKQIAVRSVTFSSEDERESLSSELSEKRYSYEDERERDDRFHLSKNKPCRLCRSENHRERNCPNVFRRCSECHKLGHLGIDCTIRKRRLANECRNDERTSRSHKYHYSRR